MLAILAVMGIGCPPYEKKPRREGMCPIWNNACAVSDKERLSQMLTDGCLPLGSWTHRRMHEAIPAEVSEVGASPGLAQMVTVDVVLYLRGLGCVRAGGDSGSRCCMSGPFGGGVRERDLRRTGFCVGRMVSCA